MGMGGWVRGGGEGGEVDVRWAITDCAAANNLFVVLLKAFSLSQKPSTQGS